MSKVSTFSAEERMTVDMFLRRCVQCASKPRKEDNGVFYLCGTVFRVHLYLDSYRIDLFDSFFPFIVIDTNKNIIKIWVRYGARIEVNGEYKYDFSAVEPTYIIEGLLCNEDEVVNKDPEDEIYLDDEEGDLLSVEDSEKSLETEEVDLSSPEDLF